MADTYVTGNTISEVRCFRCSWVWTPRKPRRPITCPNCNSPYWFEKRKTEKPEPDLVNKKLL